MAKEISLIKKYFSLDLALIEKEICVDASKDFYGATLYLFDKKLNRLSFMLAKNRMVTKNLINKSTACLELLGVDFGSRILIKIFNEYTGDKTFFPIEIERLKLFTDSSICLSWLN